MVTLGVWWPLTSDFVPFVGDPRECRGGVAFPPSFGPQPSGAIEETATIFESTLCCVAPRVGVTDPYFEILGASW